MAKSKMAAMLALSALALSSMGGDYPTKAMLPEPMTDEDMERRLKKLQEAKIAEYKRKGLKKYVYPHGVVWAMNQKNADRKAKNQKLI